MLFDFRRMVEQDGREKPENIRISLEKIQPEVTTALKSRVSMIDLMRSQDPEWGIPGIPAQQQ